MNDTIILITQNGMGRGEPVLQITLIKKYFELLLESKHMPYAMCFYTEGVRLVLEDSPILEHLHRLEANGVRLIICSTCLNFYQLQDKVKAGIVGGMTDILEAQARASKVITL